MPLVHFHDPAAGAGRTAARRRRTIIERRRGDVVPSSISPVAPAGALRAVVVAIPARDEEASIAACLASIDRAAGRCRVPVRVVVAADRCRDRTAELAAGFVASHCEVAVVTGRWRSVGAARAAAVAAGTSHGATGSWIANTDADCRVPEDWLDRQLELARRGIHAVAGTVRLDLAVAPAALAQRFTDGHAVGAPRRRHVHAANFGVHLDAYRRAGGWSPASALGEEHHLWRRLGRQRCRLTHDADLWVYTSHRLDGRAAGGFASYLRRLGAVHGSETAAELRRRGSE